MSLCEDVIYMHEVDRCIFAYHQPTSRLVRKSGMRLIFSMPCISPRLAPQCTYQASKRVNLLSLSPQSQESRTAKVR